jgi:hypothetical protein
VVKLDGVHLVHWADAPGVDLHFLLRFVMMKAWYLAVVVLVLYTLEYPIHVTLTHLRTVCKGIILEQRLILLMVVTSISFIVLMLELLLSKQL